MTKEEAKTQEIRIHNLHKDSEHSASEGFSHIEEEGRKLIEMLIEGTASAEEMEAAQEALAQKMAENGLSEMTVSMSEDMLDDNGNVKDFAWLEHGSLTLDGQVVDEAAAMPLHEGDEINFDDVGESIANAGLLLVEALEEYKKNWERRYVDVPAAPQWAELLLKAEKQLSQMANRLAFSECVPSMTGFCLMVAKTQIAERFISEATRAEDFPENKWEDINRAIFYVQEAESRLGVI